MRMSWEDVVLIEEGKTLSDPTVVTVNCPDKAGLGCDLLRIILEFGLYVTRGGLIHDVTEVLCELNLSIQRVKVTTTPDGKVLDLFFITDATDKLQTNIRREETCEHLRVTLGECCISCELQLAGPEYDIQEGHSCISEEVAEELFSSEMVDQPQTIHDKVSKVDGTSITVDNQLSPTHTLLQIQCPDQKGLIYDVFKIFKDYDIRVVHGRFYASVQGYRSLDLFIENVNGKVIVDKDNQVGLCSRLKEEMQHPLRVIVTNCGPDTELLVANLVELSGKGRPRVFYDVTLALKKLRICVFSAEIGRHSASNRQWEVYRFRLDESRGFPLTSNRAKRDIVDEVSRTLMGW